MLIKKNLKFIVCIDIKPGIEWLPKIHMKLRGCFRQGKQVQHKYNDNTKWMIFQNKLSRYKFFTKTNKTNLDESFSFLSEL